MKLAVLAAGGLLVVIAAIWLLGADLRSAVVGVKDWVGEQGALGWVVFVVGFVVLSTLTIPDSIMCIAAGALFGFLGALALVLLAATTARVVQFVLARRVLAERVLRQIGRRPKLSRITEAVLRDQTRLQLMIRLTPMSFTLVSYVFGAIGVRFGGYLVALVGTLPLHLVMIYIGAEGAQMAELAAEEDRGGWSLRDALELGGLAVSVIVLALVTRTAVREVRAAVGHSDDPEGQDRAGEG